MPSFSNISSLSTLDQILFNKFGKGPTAPVPFSLIQDAFQHYVDLQPYAIAAEHDSQTITYLDLDNAANSLANKLIAGGLQSRQRVCLVVQRSIPMLIALLAVLKAGCQYIPLDGGIAPDDTLRHVLSDTEAKYVLCLGRFRERVEPFVGEGCRIIVLDGEENTVLGETRRPGVDIVPSDGAYMIYTSGTTGRPKGVDVNHIGATNLLCLYPGNLGICPGTNVAQCLSISFDMGQWEILATLMNGGTLLLRGSDWAKTLSRAHTVISTPSILQRYRKADYPTIKVAVVGGEPCPKALADEWKNGCHFINCCGPTEVSILNTMLEYNPSRPLSIGKPIPNSTLYILDEDENPVPIGGTGFMWAGGRCVSRGYQNLPDLTSQRYKYDKFANDGSRMFNTGDLVRWLDDGNVDHQGRSDDQIKIKGFRVELDSISSAIEKTPGVIKGCAIFRDQILWGFYSGSYIEESEVREVVARHQPYYAVPSQWEYRPTLPLTLNGKVDKRILMDSVKEKRDMLAQATLDIRSSIPSPPPQSTFLQPPSQTDTSSSTTQSSSASSISSCKKEKDVIITISEVAPEFKTNSTTSTSLSPYVLPPKNGHHRLRALRFKFFSLYRRFFTFVILFNISCLVWILTSHHHTLQKLATATAANFTAAVLLRQDHVVNLLFTIFCSVPTWAPLFIRRNFARIFHIGGIHSSAAVASTMWFMAFTVVATVKVKEKEGREMRGVVVISWFIVAFLLGVVSTAHPLFRKRFHNNFELTHRFAGWTALGLFWIQTVLATDGMRDKNTSLGMALVQSPGFWFLCVSTGSIILPWLTLRKVSVRADVLSHHAVRLYFDYTTPVIGAGVRLSRQPLLEWHAFAAIPKPEEKGFSLLVSKAGDWTSAMIESPPPSIYVRGVPACGVLRMTTLFKSIVLVATGSGIGPCLPVIYAKRIPVRVLWSTPSPEKNFGNEIIEAIKSADENAIIHDTKVGGRPDLVALAYQLYKESGAEAVCVIANQKVTQMVVYGMESRGIPAYGAIFDS